MFTKLTKLLKKTEGKIFTFITIGAFIFSQTSCTFYKYTDINHDQLTESKRFQKNVEKYNLYVHQKDEVYTLNEVELTKDSSIKGKAKIHLEPMVFPDSSWSKKEKKAYFKEHKYDIHIYTHSQQNLEANLGNNDKHYELTNVSDGKEVMLNSKNIENIYISAVDTYTSVSKGVVVLLIVLGVILTVALTTLLIIAGSNASAQGSQTSSQNSQGSIQSNSNSNSGGSSGQGQGSSGSSGGGSGSSGS